VTPGEIVADVEKALQTSELAPAEKHHLLARVMMDIRPHEDSYLFRLKLE